MANTVEIRVTATGAEQASKILAQVAKEGGQLGSVTSAGAKQAQQALDGMGSSARRVFEIFTGVNLAAVFQQAVGAIKSFVAESSKLGREQQLQEATFKSFASSVGVAGDVLAAQIEKVADGIIDSGDAMKIAMRGLSAGLQPEQIVTLTDAARQLAKSLGVDAVEAYESLTEAIATGRSRRLEAVNITVDMESALESYAASIGKTVKELDTAGERQALFLATMKAASPVIESNRKVNDEFGESMQRLRVAWQDVQETVGVFVNSVALDILGWLKQVRTDIGDITPSLTALGESWDSTWRNATRVLSDFSGEFVPIKSLVQGSMAAIAELLVIVNSAILTYERWTGSIRFVGLVLDDLANRRLPDMSAHTATVTKRVEDARKEYDASVKTLHLLRDGVKETTGAVDDLGPAVSAGTNSLGGMNKQVKALTPDIKALAAETEKLADAILKGHVAAAEARIADTEQDLKLELEITNKLLEEEKRLTDLSTAGWIAYADAKFGQTEDDLKAELDITNQKLAEEKKALDDVNAGWVAHAEAVLAGTEADLEAIAKTNAPLRTYLDTLEDIALQSKLFGPNFDALAPTISAVTAEIVRLGKAGQDVTVLQEKLAGLKQVQELKGVFNDVFSSIGSAISTSIQGVILGTQTMAQAWEKMWQSIVLSFINSGIQRLLKGLQDTLWDFVGGLFGSGGSGGGGGGGGILDAIIGGISSLFGGGGSNLSASPVNDDSLSSGFNGISTAASAVSKGLDFFGLKLGSLGDIIGGIAGAAGLAASVWGLTQSSGSASSKALSAGGTAVSAYSVAQSVSTVLMNSGVISSALPTISTLIAKGLAVVAPGFASTLSTALVSVAPKFASALTSALGTATTAATTGTSAATTGVAGALGALGPALSGATAAVATFAAFLSYGMLGKSEDQRAEQQNNELYLMKIRAALAAVGDVTSMFTDIGQALSSANLPDSLKKVGLAVRSLPDLTYAIGLNMDGFTELIPELRARVGFMLVKAFDEAAKQGVDTGFGSPLHFGTTAQNPYTSGGGGDFSNPNSINLAFLNDLKADTESIVGGQPFRDMTDILQHILELTGEEGRTLASILAAQMADGTAFSARTTGAPRDDGFAGDPETLWGRIMTPEKIAELTARIGGDITNFQIDPAQINALLDKEFLTIALRNAVVDVGAIFGITADRFADAGLGRDASGSLGVNGEPAMSNWRLTPGDSTTGGNWSGVMPSVAEIAEVQRRLDEAGFKPGEYGIALKNFLVSIDANIVNNPMWADFAKTLDGVADPAGLTAALSGSADMSTASFSNAAESIIDGLSAAIAEQVKARKGATDADAIAAIDQTIEILQSQLTAWSDGFQHLYASALNVAAQLPPDLGGQFREAVLPLYDALIETMRTGTAEQASLAAQTFSEQVGAWGAFAQSVAEAVDIDALLPPDLGGQFEAMMRPEYDQILTTLKEGNATLAAFQIDQFNKVLAAWKSIAGLMSTLDQEIAVGSGDIMSSLAAWEQHRGQLDRTLQRAGAAFDAALESGDIQAIADSAAGLHQATVARYQAEIEMAEKVKAAIEAAEAAIEELLGAAQTLVSNVTIASNIDIAQRGDFSTVETLLGTLAHVATAAETASQRLWAMQAGIQAIVDTLPTAIAALGSMQNAADWLASGTQTADQLRAGGPSQITGAIIGGARPFLSAQQSAIDAASGGDKLAILQQQAEAFKVLAQAAIDGVNQWAEQAIEGARAAAAEVIAGLAAERDAKLAAVDLQIEAVDKQLAGIDKQIDGIQRAEQAAQEFRRAEMDALREQIAKAKEFEAAVESMAKFIDELKKGPLGPGNPADKLAIAQDSFSKALAEYNANPTGAGLTNLQGLAQSVLQIAEPIFSKPSPQFQALSATMIKQLLAAQALAEGQATDSEILQSQLDLLTALDKTATESAKAQIDALNAQKEILGEQRRKLEALKEGITKDFEKQTQAIETALADQERAIREAADKEIREINAGLSAALKDNAAAQAPLIEAQIGAQMAILNALRSTQFGATAGDILAYIGMQQQVQVGLLAEIRDALNRVVPAESGMARVTEGLYHLHDDEMVLPRAMADAVRNAGMSRGIRSAADGAGLPEKDLPNTGYYAPGSGTAGDPWMQRGPKFAWSGPAADRLNQLENQIYIVTERYRAALKVTAITDFDTVRIAREQSGLAAQIASLKAQQQQVLDTLPPPTTAPPPGGGSTGGTYVPPGPGWLSRAQGAGTTGGGGDVVFNITVEGDVRDEEKTATAIANKVLPLVRSDPKLGVVIDNRAIQVVKRFKK